MERGGQLREVAVDVARIVVARGEPHHLAVMRELLDERLLLVGGKQCQIGLRRGGHVEALRRQRLQQGADAGLSVSRTDLVGRLSGNILKDASDRGAEAVIVACPMCHSNLDMRRSTINRHLMEPITIPVLYVTQVLGLAIGLSAKDLGLKRHFVGVNLKEAELCQE